MGAYPRMVWIDLDDTLFDHSYSVARGLECIRRQYPAFASHPTEELVRLYNIALNEVYPDYLSGSIDFPEMRRQKFDRFCVRADVPKSEAPDTATFHSIYDEGYFRERRATPGSMAALQRLKDHGIEIAILTNGVRRIQEEKLRVIGFDSLIPFLLPSEESGTAKPDPRIFHWALQRTRTAAQDVVMIGDNPINDITGALQAGIRAIYYSPSASESTIVTEFGIAPAISDWNQIPEVLQATSSPAAPAETIAQ